MLNELRTHYWRKRQAALFLRGVAIFGKDALGLRSLEDRDYLTKTGIKPAMSLTLKDKYDLGIRI